MGFLYMAAAVACRALNNAVLNVVAKTRIKNRCGHYLFATIISAVAVVFVMIISKGIPEIESVDILHGIILGVLGIAEEFFLLSALECGHMSATLICALMSYAVTHMTGIFIWGHTLDALDWIGIAFAIACVLSLVLDFCNKGIEDAHERKEFSHWRKYALIVIGVTALVEIAEESHTKVAASADHMGYYFIAFLSATVFAGILFLISYIGKKEPTHFTWDAKFIGMLLFSGIMKALIYIVVGLATLVLEPSLRAILNSCALIVILVLIDRLYFRTKLRYNNYLAAGLAIAAVLLLR